ncbi:hypothetical protein [Caldimonas sp.]|uniref:hypothetical protein n=1 Tax=Caldimonas sp. TaxID=2838790 RepID=UPI0039190C11
MTEPFDAAALAAGWLDSRAELHTVGADARMHRISGHIAQALSVLAGAPPAAQTVCARPW